MYMYLHKLCGATLNTFHLLPVTNMYMYLFLADTLLIKHEQGNTVPLQELLAARNTSPDQLFHFFPGWDEPGDE